jgi:methyltransferase (TIGR00027 family)
MEDRSSFTAETVALQRAFESARPAGERLFCDPYAAAFLRPGLRVLAEAAWNRLLRRAAVGLYDAVAGPGPRPSAVARTRFIDEQVEAAVVPGGQCVLLGAGFDARAHRLPGLAGGRVFEVDHPATQAVKRAVLERHGVAGGHVRYAPVDFELDDLAQALCDAGFDRGSPAVFVWEGVTNYLTDAAVDATLAVVRELAGPGSRLVLTYVDRRALAEPSPFPEARRWVRGVARAGEPWTFGLLPDEAAGFFAGRGFRICADVSSYDAGRAWFAGQGRRENGSRLYRIAVAEVVGTSAVR